MEGSRLQDGETRDGTYPWAWKLPEGAPEVGVDEVSVGLDESILDGEEDEEDGNGLQRRKRQAPREVRLEVCPGEPPQEGGGSAGNDIHSKRTKLRCSPSGKGARMVSLTPHLPDGAEVGDPLSTQDSRPEPGSVAGVLAIAPSRAIQPSLPGNQPPSSGPSIRSVHRLRLTDADNPSGQPSRSLDLHMPSSLLLASSFSLSVGWWTCRAERGEPVLPIMDAFQSGKECRWEWGSRGDARLPFLEHASLARSLRCVHDVSGALRVAWGVCYVGRSASRDASPREFPGGAFVDLMPQGAAVEVGPRAGDVIGFSLL